MTELTAAATATLALHHRRIRRRVGVTAALGVLALVALLVDLSTGPAGLPLGETLRALTGSGAVSRGTEVIVWQVRLPMAVMALLVGGALGLAGAEMQTVLDNPLAEPFTLGVSAAAALGAAVTIVLGVSLPFLPAAGAASINAFLFAMAVLMLLHLLTSLHGGGPEVLVLFGIALSLAAQALLGLVQYVASPDALQQLVFWTMGSLGGATWPRAALMAAVLVVAVPFALVAAPGMTALRLGPERAASMGVDVRRLRRRALLRISLLAASAVSMTGIIGFIGLAGPHIARLLVSDDHRFYLPASLFTGALILSLASTASKLVVPGVVLPIGIVTSLVGLPVFFWLIMRRGR